MFESEKKLKLTDLIDVEFLQEFQDTFAETMNVASLIYDMEAPVTKPSGFTDFCMKYTRGSDEGSKKCQDCDLKWGNIAAETGKPVIYGCHAGLIDFAVPIKVAGRHIGTIFGGQVLTEPPEEASFRALAKELGINEDEYIEALRKIKIVPRKTVDAAAHLLYLVANSISKISLKNFELIKKTKRENLYRNITEAIRSSLNIDETKQKIVEIIGKTLEADRCFIMDYDKSNDTFLIVKHEYLSSDKIESYIGADVNEDVPNFMEEFKKGNDLVIDNKEIFINGELKTFETEKESIEKFKVHSCYAFPLYYKTELLGVLGLHYLSEIHEVSADEIKLIKTLANQITIALFQAKLYQATQLQMERESLLRNITAKIGISLDVEEILSYICEETSNLFSVKRTAIASFPDPKYRREGIIRKEYKKDLELKGLETTNNVPQLANFWALNLTEHPGVLAFDNLEKSDVPDYFKAAYKSMDIKSLIGASIKKGDKSWGCIVLSEYTTSRHWSDEEKNLLKTIADQVSIALNQAELYQHAKETAERETILRKIVESVRSSLDINEVKKLVIDEVCASFKADRCYFRTFDRLKNWLSPADSEYLSSPEVKSMLGIESEQESFRYFIDEVEKRKKKFYPIVVNEAFEKTPAHEAYAKTFDILADYAVPIVDRQDELLWMVLHYVKEDPKLTEEDLKLLETIAYQVDIAFEQIRLYNEAKKTAERETTLRKVLETIRSSIDINEIKNKIVNEVGKLLNVDACFIMLYDAAKDYFYVDEYSEYLSAPDNTSFVDFDSDHVNLKWFINKFKQNKELIIPNFDEFIVENKLEGTPEATFLKREGFNLKSSYNIAINYSGNMLGYLVLQYTKEYQKLAEDDLELLKNLAIQAGIALHQAKSYQTIQMQVQRESLLRNITEKIRISLNIEETLAYICEETTKLFDVQRTAITLFPDDQNYEKYILRKEYKTTPELMGFTQSEAYQKVAAYWGEQLISQDVVLAVDNIEDSGTSDGFKMLYGQMGIKSIMGTSVRKGKDVWGTLVLSEYTRHRHWSDEEKNLLKTIADQVYISLNQSEMKEQEQKQAKREKFGRNIVEILRNTLDKKMIKHLFVQNIAKYFGADRVFFSDYDSKKKMYLPVDAYSEYLSSEKEKSFVGYDWSNEAAREYIQPLLDKRELIIQCWGEYIEKNPRGDDFKALFEDANVKSSYNLPVLYEGNIIGYFCIEFTQEECKKLPNEDIGIIRNICTQAAIALYHAEIYEREKETAERESLLRKIIEKIRSSIEIDKTLTYICSEIARLFNVQRASISEFPDPLDYSKYIVKIDYKAGNEIEGITGLKYQAEVAKYFGDILSKRGDILAIDSLLESDTPDYFKESYDTLGVKALLAIPIRKGEDTWGILILTDYKSRRKWTDEEIALAGSVASQIFIAIKQAELYAALKQSTDNQNAILNNIPFMAWLKDSQSKLLAVNNEYAKMCNTPIENILGKTDFDFFPKEYAELYIKEDKAVMELKQTIPTVELITDDKGARWHETFKSPVFNDKGDVVGTVGVSRDITEKKEADLERIKQQKQLLKASEREKFIGQIILKALSTLDLNQILQLVKDIGMITKADRCYFVEADEYELKGKPINYDGEWRLSPDIKSIIGYEFSTEDVKAFVELYLRKRDLEIFDYEALQNSQDEQYAGIKKYGKLFDLKSGIGIPFLYMDKLVAVLCIEYVKEKVFPSEDELAFLRILGNQIGLAFNQIRLYQSTKQTAEREKILKELIIGIKLTQNIDQTYSYLLTQLTEIFDANGAIFIKIPDLEYEKSKVKYEYIKNNELPSFIDSPFPDECSDMFAELAKSPDPLIINDTKNLHAQSESAQEFCMAHSVKSFMAMPLVKPADGGDAMGVIVVLSSELRLWVRREAELLSATTNTAASVIWEIENLKEKAELINTFILTLSTKFQTPLIEQEKALDFLASQEKTQPIAKFKDFINETLKNIKNLSGLLTMLLESYYYESGKKELIIKPFQVAEIINLSVNELKELADSKSIKININNENQLPEIKLDEAEMTKAIRIILKNAIIYAPEKGTVEIKSYKIGNDVGVCISDNGPGLAPDISDKLFQRYAMAQAMEKKTGAGLGLYLAKLIVEAHKGKIWHETSPETGTIFCLVFPVQQ